MLKGLGSDSAGATSRTTYPAEWTVRRIEAVG